MTETLRSADYVSYLDAASSILARHSGSEATDLFGLRDVFTDGDHSPAYAFLEAQGRAGTVTPALSMLGAAAAGDTTGVLLAVPFGRGSLVAATGVTTQATVVIDDGGDGVVALAATEPVRRGGAHADDYLTLYEGDGTEPRAAVLAQVRLGATAEILGVCDRLIDDAVTHVRARRQFGQALAEFQAVQHLLAWAATERHQLRCLLDLAVHASQRAPVDPQLAEAAKAMAGRVLHAVAQTAIQVTGAISFTWEYSLNQLHHRGLALDQLAGPSADLVGQIGRRAREEGHVDPLFELTDI